MRDSMIFYRSFYEAIKELPLETQGEIYNAIFTYGLDFKVSELKGVSKTIWTLIKPQIDANIKRFENGNKPKAKQNESKKEAKIKQKVIKSEANNNNNNNNNVNVNDNVNNCLMSEIKISDVPQNQIDYYNVADAFFKLFNQNAIDLGVRWSHLEKLTFKKCVTPIRLLATTDSRTRDEMLLVFDLIKKDLFWKQNIQSTEKLREKFDSLLTKAKNYDTHTKETKRPFGVSKFADLSIFD